MKKQEKYHMVNMSHDCITRVMICSVIVPYDVYTLVISPCLCYQSIMKNHTILKYDQMLIEPV